MRSIARVKAVAFIDGQRLSWSPLAKLRLLLHDFRDWLHHTDQDFTQDNEPFDPFPVDQAAALRRGALLSEVKDATAAGQG